MAWGALRWCCSVHGMITYMRLGRVPSMHTKKMIVGSSKTLPPLLPPPLPAIGRPNLRHPSLSCPIHSPTLAETQAFATALLVIPRHSYRRGAEA